jgi:hypothetical protein
MGTYKSAFRACKQCRDEDRQTSPVPFARLVSSRCTPSPACASGCNRAVNNRALPLPDGCDSPSSERASAAPSRRAQGMRGQKRVARTEHFASDSIRHAMGIRRSRRPAGQAVPTVYGRGQEWITHQDNHVATGAHYFPIAVEPALDGVLPDGGGAWAVRACLHETPHRRASVAGASCHKSEGSNPSHEVWVAWGLCHASAPRVLGLHGAEVYRLGLHGIRALATAGLTFGPRSACPDPAFS